MQTLRNQLEDSSRWNASLQSRLDEMRQRVGGVGRDVDPEQTTGNDQHIPFSTEISDSRQQPLQTIPELQQEVASLKTQLQDAEHRRRSLEDALDLGGLRRVVAERVVGDLHGRDLVGLAAADEVLGLVHEAAHHLEVL